MVNPQPEIYRLTDLMPASGRMWSKLQSRPEQPEVIRADFPVPWKRDRPIYINFDLWSQLPRPQRDMLLLRTVAWLGGVTWFELKPYQGVAAAGLVGTLVELVQVDAVGIVAAGGLTALAVTQIWRSHRSSQRELDADEAAIRVAQRRGYEEADAARHLQAAIESAARLENRVSLSFTELLRCQNLKAIAGLSAHSVPEPMRRS